MLFEVICIILFSVYRSCRAKRVSIVLREAAFLLVVCVYVACRVVHASTSSESLKGPRKAPVLNELFLVHLRKKSPQHRENPSAHYDSGS